MIIHRLTYTELRNTCLLYTSGHEIKYRATTEKGKTKEFTVTVVDEDHIEIEGDDKIAIPLDGEDNEQYTYTCLLYTSFL